MSDNSSPCSSWQPCLQQHPKLWQQTLWQWGFWATDSSCHIDRCMQHMNRAGPFVHHSCDFMKCFLFENGFFAPQCYIYLLAFCKENYANRTSGKYPKLCVNRKEYSPEEGPLYLEVKRKQQQVIGWMKQKWQWLQITSRKVEREQREIVSFNSVIVLVCVRRDLVPDMDKEWPRITGDSSY